MGRIAAGAALRQAGDGASERQRDYREQRDKTAEPLHFEFLSK